MKMTLYVPDLHPSLGPRRVLRRLTGLDSSLFTILRSSTLIVRRLIKRKSSETVFCALDTNPMPTWLYRKRNGKECPEMEMACLTTIFSCEHIWSLKLHFVVSSTQNSGYVSFTLVRVVSSRRWNCWGEYSTFPSS